MAETKYLVLDTNIYLHYKDFEQIDWNSLFGGDVTICLPQRVLEEVDKHKDQSRGKLQKRARKLSARFSEILLQNATTKVPVKVMDNPPSTAFDDPQYHKEIADDWIILSALHSSQDFANVVIVSGDNGILLKAKRHGLGFYKMPEEFLLADEPSEEEKEIKRLKQQITKYENRRPAPEVVFRDETQLLTIEKPEFIDVNAEMERYQDELKRSHPYESMAEEPKEATDYLLGRRELRTYNTAEQKQEYNKELDEYFKKKTRYKELQLKRQLMLQRFFKLELWLINGGTASLGDTTIFVTFPPEVSVYNEDSKVTIRVEDPKEPILNNNLNMYSFGLTGPAYYNYNHKEELEIWSPAKELESHEFKYQSHRLTQGLLRPMSSADDIYIDIAKCGNFTIKWTIIDSELIERVEGELHVVVKDKE